MNDCFPYMTLNEFWAKLLIKMIYGYLCLYAFVNMNMSKGISCCNVI